MFYSRSMYAEVDSVFFAVLAFLSNLFDNLKILRHVCNYVQPTVRNQDLGSGSDELGAKKPALMVAFLGPGVRKIHMYALQTTAGDVADDEIPGIAA